MSRSPCKIYKVNVQGKLHRSLHTHPQTQSPGDKCTHLSRETFGHERATRFRISWRGGGWVCARGRSLWASLESQSRESVRFSEACDALWRTNGELTDLHQRIRTVDKQKRSEGRLELCFLHFDSISVKHFDSALWLSDHILSGQSFIEVLL